MARCDKGARILQEHLTSRRKIDPTSDSDWAKIHEAVRASRAAPFGHNRRPAILVNQDDAIIASFVWDPDEDD